MKSKRCEDCGGTNDVQSVNVGRSGLLTWKARYCADCREKHRDSLTENQAPYQAKGKGR